MRTVFYRIMLLMTFLACSFAVLASLRSGFSWTTTLAAINALLLSWLTFLLDRLREGR